MLFASLSRRESGVRRSGQSTQSGGGLRQCARVESGLDNEYAAFEIRSQTARGDQLGLPGRRLEWSGVLYVIRYHTDRFVLLKGSGKYSVLGFTYYAPSCPG